MKKRARARETMSSMSPGNQLAKMLDDRMEMVQTIRETQYTLRSCEEKVIRTILKDPVGFEGVMTINWRKLNKMFGGDL